MPTDDAYVIRCPSCGASLQVRQDWAGREAKCHRCQQNLVVPAPSAVAWIRNVERLRTPAESGLRIACLVVAILIYLLLFLSCVGLFYLGLFLLGTYVALAFMMARVRSNGIKAGPDQLPDVYESARRASAALGLADVPDLYVIQEGGLLNAFATKFAFRRYVVLYSDLVDACGSNSAELDMIVAHEVGHLALGHLTWGWILFPAMFVPFLTQAYSRACEYSADRCGWSACRNHEAAMRGLLILAAGGQYARMASLKAFLRQRNEVRGFWQTVVEWLSTHPWLTRRVEALSVLSPPAEPGPVFS